MIFCLVFHERDTSAHDRSVYNHNRTLRDQILVQHCPSQPLEELLEIITVRHIYHIPACCLVFLPDPYGHYIFGIATYLQMIPVHYAEQILQAVFDGKTPGLRNLPLLLFTISHYTECLYSILAPKPG